MELRYVWERYSANAVQGEPYEDFLDRIDSMTIDVDPSVQFSAENCQLVTPANADADFDHIYCAEDEDIDPKEYRVKPEQYFGIEAYDESVPDLEKITYVQCPVVYCPNTINPYSSGIILIDALTIEEKTSPEPTPNEESEETPPTEGEGTEETPSSPGSTITIMFYGTQTAYTESYEKGDSLIGHTTSEIDGLYPTDGYSIDSTGVATWYVYIGYDEVPVDDSLVETSTTTVAEAGGSVTVSVGNLNDLGEYLVSNGFTYTWRYTTDRGENWSEYVKDTRVRSFVFTVPADSTGFQVRIVASDGYGYMSKSMYSPVIERVENLPPSTPKFTSLPDMIIAEVEHRLEWAASKDEDGTVYGYVVERQVDDEPWSIIFTSNSLYTTDVVKAGASYVKYRIRAYDNHMTYSAYDTSPPIDVKVNNPPLISGHNENLGLVTEINISYTVSDPGDRVTLYETFDSTVIPGSSKVVVEGIAYTIKFVGEEWDKIDDGTHVITIVAKDSAGATSTRSYTFRKNSKAGGEDVDNRYQVFQKQEDGTYKLIRIENDSDNVLRLNYGVTVEESLEQYLPDSRRIENVPDDAGVGKIVVGMDAVYVRGYDNNFIILRNAKPPYIVSNGVPPDDKTLLWIDTQSGVPLFRYWNGSRWDHVKSIYSGGLIN